MKKTNNRTIHLPMIGLDEETNARSLDYARRTARPTLEQYIMEPFSGAWSDRLYAKAEQKGGVDEGGILQDQYDEDVVFGDKKVRAVMFPRSRTAYEKVLSTFSHDLGKAAADNEVRRWREGVRRGENQPYLLLDTALGDLEGLVQKNKGWYNTTIISILDPQTGEKVPLDEEIVSLPVALDMKRLARINHANADTFHGARSLYARIAAFENEFERQTMELYDIPKKGLQESQEVDYDLRDDSAVRYLFFPKNHLEHGEVYAGLVGQGTKNIATSTGDLTIIKSLAFGDEYTFKRGRYGIHVYTQPAPGGGLLTIERFLGEKDDQRQYSLLRVDDKVYVGIANIIKTIDHLRQIHTNNDTQLKIDFFASPPEYLK